MSREVVRHLSYWQRQCIQDRVTGRWMAEEESGIRLTRKIQGLALTAWSATKTYVATDNLWSSYNMKGVERWVNKHLCRWLGIPPSCTSVGLYIRSGQLQLTLSSVVKEFKVEKCKIVMKYRDSSYEKVRGSGANTRSRCKWAADTSVAQAESSVKLKDVIGNPCVGRQEFRTTHFQQ